MNRDETVKRMKKQLDEWNAQIGDWEKQMNDAQANMKSRYEEQLDTLRHHSIRHVVLGAFGCGAFRNPAHLVAHIYWEEVMARRLDFSVIAFAVFQAGYGPDNYSPFAKEINRE